MDDAAQEVRDALGALGGPFAERADRIAGLPRRERIRALIQALAEATGSDGATLYVHQGSELVFELVWSRSLGLGEVGTGIDFPSIRLYGIDGRPDTSSAAGLAVHERRAVQLHAGEDSLPVRTAGFDRVMDYHTRELLSVPVVAGGEVVGVLQLVNPAAEDGSPRRYGAEDIAVAERVASLLARIGIG